MPETFQVWTRVREAGHLNSTWHMVGWFDNYGKAQKLAQERVEHSGPEGTVREARVSAVDEWIVYGISAEEDRN